MEAPRLPVTFGALRGFGVTAVPRRLLAALLPDLERRRIAKPKAQDYADFQSAITAGICDRRNGVQGSVCTVAILSRGCPLWVKSGHSLRFARCPLYPQKRTLRGGLLDDLVR